MLSEIWQNTGNPHASWCIRDGRGRILVRDNGSLIYDGPEVDMPDDVKAIADEMQWPPDFKEPTP